MDAFISLLSLLEKQGIVLEPYQALIAPEQCLTHMPHFKLDVSVSLREDAVPRFSINDTGEPNAFRQRMHAQIEHIGISPNTLLSFFDLCPPGMAQTTLSLKWEHPLRCTLYFEELTEHESPMNLREQWYQHFYGPLHPPASDKPLVALGADFIRDQLVATKEYVLSDLNQPSDQHRTLAQLIPSHPSSKQKRVLLAQRYDAHGRDIGEKILWVTEGNTPYLAAKTWKDVSRIVRSLSLHKTRNWRMLVEWIRDWRWGPACVPYPDLVCFNRQPNGMIEDLILYVPLK